MEGERTIVVTELYKSVLDVPSFCKEFYQIPVEDFIPLNTKKTAFLIRSSQGKFVLKRSQTSNIERLEEMSRFLVRVCLHGIRCPNIRMSAQGTRFIITSDDCIYYLYPYIEGGRFDLSQNKVRSAIALLTRLHLACKEIPYVTSGREPKDLFDYAETLLRAASVEVSNSTHSLIRKNLGLLQSTISETEERLKKMKETEHPIYLLHGDFQPQNVIYTHESAEGILDFERAILGPPLFDLATLLCSFSARKDDKGSPFLEYLQVLDCLRLYKERFDFRKEAPYLYQLMQFFEINQLYSAMKCGSSVDQEDIITRSVGLIAWLSKEKEKIVSIARLSRKSPIA